MLWKQRYTLAIESFEESRVLQEPGRRIAAALYCGSIRTKNQHFGDGLSLSKVGPATENPVVIRPRTCQERGKCDCGG
jgi:hypothetical protein